MLVAIFKMHDVRLCSNSSGVSQIIEQKDRKIMYYHSGILGVDGGAYTWSIEDISEQNEKYTTSQLIRNIHPRHVPNKAENKVPLLIQRRMMCGKSHCAYAYMNKVDNQQRSIALFNLHD